MNSFTERLAEPTRELAKGLLPTRHLHEPDLTYHGARSQWLADSNLDLPPTRYS